MWQGVSGHPALFNDKEELMVKNLNQLKKTIKKGTCLEILVHCRPEFTGQKREVTMANTQGFYSIVPDEPDHKVSLANDGKGFVLWWCNASDWEFHDGICSIYCKGKEHTKEFLVMSFHITGQEVA